MGSPVRARPSAQVKFAKEERMAIKMPASELVLCLFLRRQYAECVLVFCRGLVLVVDKVLSFGIVFQIWMGQIGSFSYRDVLLLILRHLALWRAKINELRCTYSILYVRYSLMKIVPRDIEILCAALLQEERIMKSRLSVRSICALRRNRLSVIKKDGKGIYGYAALWPTSNPHFFELGTCWVREDKRGKGLFSGIFDELVFKARLGSTVFLITKSAKVAHEAHKRHWDEVYGWQNSPHWQKVCKPVGGLEAESKRTFSTDCKLFYAILG
jgi:hypothetical protein